MDEDEEAELIARHPAKLWLSIGGAMALSMSLAVVSFYTQLMLGPASNLPRDYSGETTVWALLNMLLPFCFAWYGLPQLVLAVVLFHVAYRIRCRTAVRAQFLTRRTQAVLILALILLAIRARVLWGDPAEYAAWELWIWQLVALSVVCGTWVCWQVERVLQPLPIFPRFSLTELVVFVMAFGAVMATFIPV